MSTPLPRGIEVLLKKASVDAEFRELLLADPNQAAASIELELQPVESAMLQTLPKEQLATVVDRTEVPLSHRRAFLGTVAATMLAFITGSGQSPPHLLAQAGISVRAVMERTIIPKVQQLIADTMEVEVASVTPATQIAINEQAWFAFRREIYRLFDVRMPLKTLKTLDTVKLLTDYVIDSLDGYGGIVSEPVRLQLERVRQQPEPRPEPPVFSFGMDMLR